MSEVGHTYGVELFFDAPPKFDDPSLAASRGRACPRAVVDVDPGPPWAAGGRST